MKTKRYVLAFIENSQKPTASHGAILNTETLDRTDQAILQHLGFREHRPDPADPTYVEYKLPVGDCYILKQVDLIIAGSLLHLWAVEHECGLTPGQAIVADARNFSWRELGILLWCLSKMTEVTQLQPLGVPKQNHKQGNYTKNRKRLT